MQRALESLAEALEQAPETPLRSLDVLPAAERPLVLETWNADEAAVSVGALHPRAVRGAGAARRRRRWRWCRRRPSSATAS